MVRGNMMRTAWVAASVAMLVSGCTCVPDEISCTDTTIAFETPTDGAAVDSPFDVSFSVKAPDGTAFNIEKATLKVDGKTLDGTISGNRASFSGVTATPGAQALVATIAQGTCSKTAAAVSVTVNNTACTTPKVTAVSFPQDTASPVGVLNGTELGVGTNLQVRVAASCTSGVQVRIKRGTETVGELTSFVNGVATVTTSLPDSDNARYDLFAELVKDGAAVNTSSANPEALGSIEVSRTPPAVALTVDPVWGPMDDADTARAGYQVRVTGTASPLDAGCTIEVPGAVPPSASAPVSTSGEVSADFTLTSGSYTATLTCLDGAGNTASATASFVVDFDPPTLTITSPANVDGGATMIVTQSPLSVTIATNAEDGSIVSIKRGTSEADSDVVASGGATLTVSFGTDGVYTLEVTVTDLAGNSTTASVIVVVTLDGCGAAFTRPAACPAFITPAQMSNGTYSFQTGSKPTCQGQAAALFRTDLLADGGMLAEVAAGTTTVGATGASSFPPLTLASGDYEFRAEITNLGADAGVSVADTCRVTVDLDGPVITNPVVPSTAAFATVNAAQDTQPLVAGVQRTLTFSARVPMGGRVDVCTTQATDPTRPASDGGFELRPTSVDCGSGWFLLQQGVTSPASGFTFPDGAYEIRVVVVGGGQSVLSPPVSIVSDAVRPCVNGLTRVLPQDANGDNRLNVAELNGAAPRLEFELGCGATQPTMAATNPVVVRDITGGVAGAVRLSTAAFATNKYTVTLTGAYATEVELNLFVELTDHAGNKNLLALPSDPATFAFRVDPLPPACDIQSPGAGQTLIGPSGAPGGMFTVSVATAADVGTNGVDVTFGTTATRELTPANGVAQTSYAVTGTSAYAVTAVCTDDSGNATTATPRNITIDLDAPTCSITSPTAMTYSVNQIATAVSVGGAEGRPVTIRTSLQPAPLGSLNVSSGVASGNISYPNGTQTVTAEVSDLAGNSCTATVAGLIVNSTSCGLSLTNVFTNTAGSWFNRSNTGSLVGNNGVIASVNANSADCRSGQTVTLQRTTPAGTATTSTTATNGDVSFTNVAVTDGEVWSMTINNGTGILTTQTFRVGLRVPVATGVTINGNTITTGQDLFFVAPSGNINLEPSAGTPKATTYFADGVAGTAGSQTNVAVLGVNGTRYGTDNGLVEVRYGAAAVVSQAINAEPFDLSSTQMTLAHNTTGAFVVRLTSAAGNSVDVVSNNASVDVIAPAGPAVSQTLASARSASVTLSWAPVFDDGSDPASGGLVGGPPTQLAGYDVRWTTLSVPSNNAMATVSDFFGSSSNQDGVTAWSANNISKGLALPPINTYYIGVMARDEVGNCSAFQPPNALANNWTEVTLTGLASSNFGQTTTVTRSVNSDTTDDLLVSASAEPGGGAVYVFFGSSALASQSGCGAGCQRLAPSDATAGAFGADLAAGGNVGDVAGEGKPDFLVSQTQSTAPNNLGRVVLYFGGTAATVNVADAVEFRGDATFRIGFASRIIADLNGDGLDEIAIAAPVATVGGVANRGRVFIFRGRSRAQWAALRTGTDPVSMVPFIPVATSADYVINGPNPTLAAAGNGFGLNRHGWGGRLGDVNGDAVPDLGIPMSRPVINRYQVVSGAAILASSVASPVDFNSPLFQVTELATTETTVTNGLGAAVLTGLDVIDSSSNDLVVSYPSAGRVNIYSSPIAAAPNPAPNLVVQGPVSFGFMVSSGMLNGDGNLDLVVSLGNLVNNEAWVLYKRGSGYDSVSGSPYFWTSRFQGVNVVGSSTTALGRASAIGDLDGASGNELVLGDERANLVKIWR